MKTDRTALLLLEQAFADYQRGDLAAAEAILAQIPEHPSALHLTGLLRVRQGRLPEAADALARAVAARPGEAQAQFNYGKVLAALDRQAEAVKAFSMAASLDPDHAEAVLARAKALLATGELPDAIEAFRLYLQKCPGHLPSEVLLGNALVAAGQFAEAEGLLAQGLGKTKDNRLRAGLHQGVAAALHGQHKYAEELEQLELALALDPARIALELERAQLLERLHRFHEAKAAYQTLLDHDSVNVGAHRAFNDLLYRLGEEKAFLSSYDHAPRTKELVLDKAYMLLSADRAREAEPLFHAALSRYGDDKRTALGASMSLLKTGRAAEAVSVLEQELSRHPGSIEIYCNLSAALAQLGDPEKGSSMAAAALAIEPYNQFALAMQGICWRMMGDERDEALNGYDDLIRVFDLEAPDGYPDMAAFNAELRDVLNGLHPDTREYLRQSLRGGTQTSENLFGSGHALVEKLRLRIEEALAQYISEMGAAPDHPLLVRRRKAFAFTGSWSSRLRDGGFHTNHLHPGGWISSCYYVDVPGAVRDGEERQGWIKFGEPSFDVGLAPRRAIQPVPGRLVLFPSYMWHGTIPFHDEGARMTIAFDAIPVEQS